MQISHTRFSAVGFATAVTAALLMSGCTEGQSDTPIAQPASTTTTPVNTSISRTPVNTREEYGDLQFLLTVRDAGVAGSDSALINAAQDICTGVANSGIQTTSQLFELLRSDLVPGVDMIDAVSVATAGILHYCPEHSDVLNS